MDMIDMFVVGFSLLYVAMFFRNAQVSAKVNAKIDELHR